MRLLYVIDSLGRAGAERSLAAMSPYYLRAGVDLDIAYLTDAQSIRAPFEEAGAKLFSLQGAGGRLGHLRRLRQVIRAREPDLIHTTLFDSDLVGRVAGVATRVPVVTSLVNVAYGPEQLANPDLHRWRVRAVQLTDALSARAVRRFHAISAHVAEIMGARLRIRRDRIDVVPRGRDPRQLGSRDPERRARARRLLGIDTEERLVVAAARHEYQKGLDVLLQAFAGIAGATPGARLVIAGREGSQTAQLMAAIDRLGLEHATRILGPRDDVSDILCAADVFAFPSRWEGLGSVLLEAMALEAPIVASDLGAVREVVGGEAVLVPPDDPARLAGSISEVLVDPRAADVRAKAAKARFLRHFTVERVVEDMLAFYDRALGGPIERSPHRLGP